MKKVVLASLLACAVTALGLPSVSAAQADQTAQPAQTAQPNPVAGAAQPCQWDPAEATPYNNAVAQTTPQAKAAGIEAYLQAFPKPSCPDARPSVLEQLMVAYNQFDATKTLDAADRLLQLDPNNLRALYAEALLRKNIADAPNTEATAKQAGLDAAAGFAQRGLVAPKPAGMSDADFKTLQNAAYPTFYSTIGDAAVTKKDGAAAVDAYKKELALVSPDATKTPGSVLQDIFQLGEGYLYSTPPDYLNCAFYALRGATYAPEPYKTAFTKTAKYCYHQYHGNTDDQWDQLSTMVTASLNPPADLATTIKPAPTPAEMIAGVISSTPDLAALAPVDREYIIQNGTPDQIAKVWDAIKGKSVTYPGALVIASTPTQVQVAIGDDAVQSKTADFTFNLAPPEDIPEPKAGATPAQKAAYKKKVDDAKKQADAVAAATAVGQTVTLQGTYDSYTPKPIMFTMTDASVVLPTATKTPAAKSPAKAPVRKPGAATAK